MSMWIDNMIVIKNKVSSKDQQLKKVIISCMMGNWLEWYEFAIFGFLTKQLSQAFFPSSDPLLALLMTYGVYATGFIMRPVGALICGYLGDRKGRKVGLLFSVGFMAVPTFCMGILPTYDHIGIIAPIVLIICRLLQGISLGGEFSGSIVCLIEHAPKKSEGLFGSWADLGSAFGMISAIFTVIILNVVITEDQLYAWGWRLPFLFGILFGLVGYLLRRDLHEPEAYHTLQNVEKAKNPMLATLKMGKMRFLLNILFLAINSSGYYFLIIYLPQQLGGQADGSLNIWGAHVHLSTLLPLVTLTLMILATSSGAYLSDKWGQISCLFMGYVGTLVLIFPLIYAHLYMGVIGKCIFYILFAWSLGFCFGPRSSFMVQFYPVHVRYTAISLTYNMANAIFGGLSPLICLTLYELTGTLYSSGGFIVCMSLLSLCSLFGLSKILKQDQLKKNANQEFDYLLQDNQAITRRAV